MKILTNIKKALITGGAGFIGSHIADALVENGCRVIIVDNLATGNLSNIEHLKEDITFIESDIRDGEMLINAARNCDVIFHQAAVVSVPQTVEEPIESAMVNDIGTLNVMEAARKNGVKRVVYASSCAVYGDAPELPKVENMRVRPQTPYAVQKYTGELNANVFYDLYGLETVGLRYFNVFGPRQDPSSPYSGVISIFMSKAAGKETPLIFGDGNQYRDFVFVKDVVKANLLAACAENIGSHVFNIGTGRYISVNDLWNMICGKSGFEIKPEYKPGRAGDIRESLADINLAEEILKYKPDYSFEQGFDITYDWYMDFIL